MFVHNSDKIRFVAFTGKLALCLLPVALTPVWGFLIAEGYLNFGGGCKDLLVLIPWFLWSLLYAIIFIVAWIKGKSTGTALVYSCGGATGILTIIWVALFIWADTVLGVYKG